MRLPHPPASSPSPVLRLSSETSRPRSRTATSVAVSTRTRRPSTRTETGPAPGARSSSAASTRPTVGAPAAAAPAVAAAPARKPRRLMPEGAVVTAMPNLRGGMLPPGGPAGHDASRIAGRSAEGLSGPPPPGVTLARPFEETPMPMRMPLAPALLPRPRSWPPPQRRRRRRPPRDLEAPLDEDRRHRAAERRPPADVPRGGRLRRRRGQRLRRHRTHDGAVGRSSTAARRRAGPGRSSTPCPSTSRRAPRPETSTATATRTCSSAATGRATWSGGTRTPPRRPTPRPPGRATS